MRNLLTSVAVWALITSSPLLAQTDRRTLPVAPPPFAGTINQSVAQSLASRLDFQPVRAPTNAPNIFLFMADDVGFSMSSAFGGPVSTPAMDRLSTGGQRYNRFNTTALCSPSRAALLTGRNHHDVGEGFLADLPTEFPGYDGQFPASAATIAETLKLNGYNTAMFGKHHNVPPKENSPSGPFDMWPTGLGFEYFYGFVSGDMHQWQPDLYRGITLLPDDDGPVELLDHRLADDAIRWVHNQKAAAPDKPFFIYYAPGSLHAPHQAPADYIARFKGKFNQGWDKLREETFQRQLAMGIIPANTKLTPRPAEIPAWSSLSEPQKAYAERSMELAAAMLVYQDEQLGRVLDELDRMGAASNMLTVIVQGDNGASAEVGPDGSLNEIGKLSNHIQESDAWRAANIAKLGGPETYESYPAGWAWAMNTPFRWTKQYASMLGGIRNGMIMSWSGHVAHPGGICAEFGHLVDIAPTLLDAAGLPAPVSVNGVKQQPYDGESLLPSLSSCQPEHPRTQYFEMAGKIGLYKNGWFLSRDDGRMAWQQTVPTGLDPDARPWTLYDLTNDFSQSTDVAADHPEQLKTMIVSWREEAEKNKVFPIFHGFIDHRGAPGYSIAKHFDYWGGDISIPTVSGPLFIGRSFTMDADIVLAKKQASGVVFAYGSRFGGWSFYLDKGRPTFSYALSTRPEDITRIEGPHAMRKGQTTIRLTYVSHGLAKDADIEIETDGTVVARGHIPRTFITAAGAGEMLDTGHDSGVPVTNYRTPHGRLEGDVRHIAIDFQ
jgi:arylsulfatase A-like enzyme